MANTKSTKKLSFAYSYGFTEGRFNSRNLTKHLKQAGYIPAKNPIVADIVIAHSAGCWHNLERYRPKIIVYVGMPLPVGSPRELWMKANKIAAKTSLSNRRIIAFSRSIIVNCLNFILHPIKNITIIRRVADAEPVKFNDALTVFITNKNDPWPISTRLTGLLHAENWSFISLEGTHAHLWQKPAEYVEIINNYAKLLAKTSSR